MNHEEFQKDLDMYVRHGFVDIFDTQPRTELGAHSDLEHRMGYVLALVLAQKGGDRTSIHSILANELYEAYVVPRNRRPKSFLKFRKELLESLKVLYHEGF